MVRFVQSVALAALLLALPLTVKARATGLPAPVACASCWYPPLHLKWQWQLSGKLDTRVSATVYDVDMFAAAAGQVRKLHRMGRHVVCYIDAGSWEDWRPDARRFPKSVIGKKLKGWPGERWLDIRQISILGPLIKNRLEKCKEKGFDAVEFDNVDGFQNATGFKLTAKDQLRYNVFLANLAHRRGLSVALKNDTDQVGRLLRYFDWSLDEQCFEYSECSKLMPFIRAGKPVFEVEYSLPRSRFCPRARKLGLDSMRKHLNLGPWLRRC